MKSTIAILSTLSLTFLISGCNQEKKVATAPPQPRPTELTAYTPKKEGEWLNMENVIRFKENSSLQFKKFDEWIGASWFRMRTMRRDANFTRPADTVYKVIEDEKGVNPSVIYSCGEQAFAFDFGAAMNRILDSARDTSYVTFRFDNSKHYTEQNAQFEPRILKGVNPATGKFQKVPKGIPESYKKGKDPFYNLLMTSTTIEVSVVDKLDYTQQGVYAKWVLQKTLKKQQESGDLDRACKAFIGADYITIAMVEQQAKEEKNARKQASNN